MRRDRCVWVAMAVLVLWLVVGASVAMAQTAADPNDGDTPARILGTPPEATPMVLVSRTHALGAGQANVTVTERLGGVRLMVKITDAARQPDPLASVGVYGTGFFGSRCLRLAPVSPGVYACMANLADVDELAVRVTRPGLSRVYYVGLPGTRLGWRCEER
ncbi:hypothetical protein LLH23_17300 [bacterium]|nr:hypothetical protein [bacterium]